MNGVKIVKPYRKALEVSRPAAMILILSSLVLSPALAQGPSDGGYSYQDEVKIEQSCKEWQKVRRCADVQGNTRLECAAKSPIARFWSMLRSRPQDDEVRVEVVRKAPEGAAASPETVEGGQQTRVASVNAGPVKKVVKKGTLPACGAEQ